MGPVSGENLGPVSNEINTLGPLAELVVGERVQGAPRAGARDRQAGQPAGAVVAEAGGHAGEVDQRPGRAVQEVGRALGRRHPGRVLANRAAEAVVVERLGPQQRITQLFAEMGR